MHGGDKQSLADKRGARTLEMVALAIEEQRVHDGVLEANSEIECGEIVNEREAPGLAMIPTHI